MIAAATRGLGPAYTKYLAELGYTNFLLISDKEEKLGEMKHMLLEKLPNMNIYTHVFDFDIIDVKKAKEELG